MELYHGTISTCAENIIKNGIKIKKGKPRVDFGQGFYTTKDIDFAISTAQNKTYKTNYHYGYEYCKPVILIYNYFPTDNLNIYEFKSRNTEWAQFIINNRNGYEYVKNTKQTFHNLDQKYDIVIGEIADNRITSIADELKMLNDKLTINDFNNMLYYYHTNQYSFHTDKSISCIKLVACDIIEKKKGDVVNE